MRNQRMTRVLVAVMIVGLVGTMTLDTVAAVPAPARASTRTAEPTVASVEVVDPVRMAAVSPDSDPTEPVLRTHPAARLDAPAPAIEASTATMVSASVATARHITGTVTNAVAGALIRVVAYNADGLAAHSTFAADGSYLLVVVAGTYTIRFEDDSARHAWGWYATSGFAARQAGASPVVVGAADVSGIDVSLPTALHITGTVTNPYAAAVPGLEVLAYNADGESAWARTAEDGTYSLAVVAGTYTIRFGGYGQIYPWGWYATSGFAALKAGASRVAVGAADVSGIDVSLPTVPPSATINALPTWRASTSIPLAWRAAEGSAAVVNYDVRYRRAAWNGGFGSYVLWRSARTGTSATFSASAGAMYCFSVRARDALGAVSAWTSQRCTAIPLDDRALSRVGSWSAGTGSAYYKGTYLRSTRSGAKLVRTGVVARQIALVATTCPTCGTVKVYWGSTLLRTIKLTSTTTVNRKLIAVTTFTSVRTGTLTIKVSSATRKVIIDGVAIRRN